MGDFYTCIDLYTDFFAEIYEYPAGKPEGINAVMLDFTHVMIDMMQANTPFLNLFWYNSPTPNFNGGVNVMFWVIFILIFVGLALQDSGARMSRARASCGKVLKINSFWKKPKGKRG